MSPLCAPFDEDVLLAIIFPKRRGERVTDTHDTIKCELLQWIRNTV